MSATKITILIILQTLLSLLLFAGLLGILIYFLRKPMRQFKWLDLAVFEKLTSRVTPFRNRIMLFITFLGGHIFLIILNLLLIFYFIFIARQNWFSIRILTIALSSLMLMLLLKNLFQRKRPLSPLLKAVKGLSFPSGHAITAVTFYGLMIFIVWQQVDIDWVRYLVCSLLVVLIITIGYTRVYLRVHYASDVLAGFIIGMLWLLISLFVLDKVEEYVRSLAIN